MMLSTVLEKPIGVFGVVRWTPRKKENGQRWLLRRDPAMSDAGI